MPVHSASSTCPGNYATRSYRAIIAGEPVLRLKQIRCMAFYVKNIMTDHLCLVSRQFQAECKDCERKVCLVLRDTQDFHGIQQAPASSSAQ